MIGVKLRFLTRYFLRDKILHRNRSVNFLPSIMAERAPTYDFVKNHAATSRFLMNEVALLVFGTKRYHLTESLNGSFAVFLISVQATVSAHIPPRPAMNSNGPQAGDKNLVSKMQEFAQLYISNRKYFQSYKVSLIYATFHGKTALPDKKEFIEKCLRQFGVDFPLQSYEVKYHGEKRATNHGTAFVDGGSAQGPALYLEDARVLRVPLPQVEKTEMLKPKEPHQDAYRVSPLDPIHTNPISARPGQRTVQDPTGSFAQYTETKASTLAPAPQTAYRDLPSEPIYANPIFPRVEQGIVQNPAGEFPEYAKTKTPAHTSQSPAVSAQAKKLRYVKCTLDKNTGGRIVELDKRQVLIKKEDWARGLAQGKEIWISKKYSVYTDI